MSDTAEPWSSRSRQRFEIADAVRLVLEADLVVNNTSGSCRWAMRTDSGSWRGCRRARCRRALHARLPGRPTTLNWMPLVRRDDRQQDVRGAGGFGEDAVAGDAR